MFKRLILTILLCVLSINSYSSKFDTIVTFGDSLSDNGNLYGYLGHFIPKSPPYYEGRFSNGPVWVEDLYQSYFPNGKTENFQDFAVGGAGAVLSYAENLPYTLDSEVTDYLYLHNYTNKNKSLFVIWIGANNYLNGPTNVDAITSSVVDSIGTNAKALIDHGAVMILMVNLPDMGKTPLAIKANTQELLTQLTDVHNEKLLAKYNELKEQYPNVNFAYLDIHSLFDQLMNQPQQFNITNVTEPCFGGGFSFRAMLNGKPLLDTYLKSQEKEHNIVVDEQLKKSILANPVLKEAMEVSYQGQMHAGVNALSSSCSGNLFWDHVHPTAPIHEFIAQFAKTALDEGGFQAINQ